ncbi:MAG: hypothetical protein U0S36_12195 [Candidatus Nanopelagicales bacterium]
MVTGGDAGELVNKAALTAGNPEGDVLFGVDSTRAPVGRVRPGVSPAASGVPSSSRPPRRTRSHRSTTATSASTSATRGSRRRASRSRDPRRPREARVPDLLVVENAATSSPGLAFLLATVATYGEDGYQDYWSKLRANVKESSTAGPRPTRASTPSAARARGPRRLLRLGPPAEIVYASDPKPTKPFSSVMESSCARQVEYAGVLAGADARAAPAPSSTGLACGAGRRAAVDVRLPGRARTPLPDVFATWAATPASPLVLDPAEIDAKRSQWVDAWDQVTLR